MIGTNDDRSLVDWRKRTVDGETVYELEYDEPISEPAGPSPWLFGASSGGTVPEREQEICLPDGERIPASDAVFEADGTTLRIRRESSLRARVGRYLPFF
ncbi:hypothetical protein [Natronolimnohabitans innermongolicus]|uniref:Uncharacterized protein n=1 Tax=Natronolimnohabitans innermongolicus JCM 12255 TaxID=1227499 RepID=L9XJ39_9EURY|nr:hypothetical protein [Natronolimnohabitans innermongolicus]ELY61607.1 hypothetical protein C493_02046 [Natronolimnohabitans innermongolicus JCM 12255]